MTCSTGNLLDFLSNAATTTYSSIYPFSYYSTNDSTDFILGTNTMSGAEIVINNFKFGGDLTGSTSTTGISSSLSKLTSGTLYIEKFTRTTSMNRTTVVTIPITISHSTYYSTITATATSVKIPVGDTAGSGIYSDPYVLGFRIFLE